MKEQESDTEQGFIPNRIQQNEEKKHQRTFLQIRKNLGRPLDYQTRYIHSNSTIKKQLSSILYAKQSNSNYEEYKQSINKSIGYKKKPYKDIEVSTPYQKYFNTAEYQLLYWRNKGLIQGDVQDSNFSKNQIILNCLANYQESSYLLLKDFQLPSQLKGAQLEFQSRFQSGNLMWVFKHNNSPYQYTLFIQNDTNTYGYNHWFYFSVKNTYKSIKYKFHIVNFKKKHSFFKEGQKIAYYSLRSEQNNGICGWNYGGNNITYGKSPFTIQSSNTTFYTLSFEMQFEYDNDCILMALNIPYSYSKLNYRLKQLQQNAKSMKIKWEKIAITHTLANNAVPYVSIYSQKCIQQPNKVIILLARQHPGQTWSSFLMDEILNSLLDGSQQSNWILQNFTIKVFPMVNIDGVIYGNFRCDLSGVDLNRQWSYPSKILHPQIYYIKKQIQKLSRFRIVECCFDLHGHSQQYNIFTYTCKTDNISCRILPYIMSQLNSGFNFNSCTFGISKYKESTARANIFNILNNFNVHTIECSFFGTKINSIKQPFHTSIIKQASKNILQAIKIYFNNQQLRKTSQIYVNKQIIALIDTEKKNRFKEVGSESQPQEDQMDMKEKIGKIFPIKLLKDYNEEIMPDIKLPTRKTFKSIKKKSQDIEKIQIIKKPINQAKQIQVKQQSIINRRYLANYKRNQFFMPNKKLNQNNMNKTTIDQIVNVVNFSSKPPTYSTLTTQYEHSSLILLKGNQTAYKLNQQKLNITNIRMSPIKSTQRQKFYQNFEGQQLPTLCILSENRKKKQIERIKEKINKSINHYYKPKNDIINFKKLTHKLELKSHLQLKKQQKVREQKSLQYVGKLWKDNFNRYSKQIHFFMEVIFDLLSKVFFFYLYHGFIMIFIQPAFKKINFRKPIFELF